jgi:hypothetical protein
MPDGTRKRRFSLNPARRRWYATHRAARFFRRFGLTAAAVPSLNKDFPCLSPCIAV